MAKKISKKPAAGTPVGPSGAAKKRDDRDRRVRQAERLARTLKILERIQSRGRWTPKDLADELECSERTIYRDLKALEFAGVPFYQEGAEKFIRVRPDYQFPVVTLTEEEALGQAIATALTRTPGLDIGPGATPTTRKLEALASGDIQEILADALQLVSVLDLKLADHSRHHEIIKTAQYALLEGRQATGQYESPYEPGPVKIRLHPYRLCLIKNAWYLIARATDSEEPRTFRIARFKTLRMLDQPAEVPDDFDLKRYFGNAWGVFRGQPTYDVEVWFTAEVGRIVMETTWHHTQKARWNQDGSVTLTFKVDGLEEIAHWVLGWAGSAKIVRPAELRDRIVGILQKALEMHQPY